MVIYDSSSWLHSQALHHLAEVIDHPNICILGLGHLDIAPLSARVASFGQLFEKVQWNIPRQVNLSCLNISVYIYIYYILYI